MSASSRLKHVHTRFYLVKDHQDRGELEVRYEPTGTMWSDILTKPKQGKAFRVMRGVLMNIPEDYDDEVERRNTHPDLLPKFEANPAGSYDKDTLRTVVDQDKTLTRRTTVSSTKSSGHRRSVLGERASSKNRTPLSSKPVDRGTRTHDLKIRTVRTPYDTELARKVSKRIRTLRYLRDIKSSRIRSATSKLDVPMELPLQ